MFLKQIIHYFYAFATLTAKTLGLLPYFLCSQYLMRQCTYLYYSTDSIVFLYLRVSTKPISFSNPVFYLKHDLSHVPFLKEDNS